MTYYRRPAWGARKAARGIVLEPARVQGLAFHWPGDDVRRDTPEEVMAALRGWQAAHMDGRGYRDIAYQEAIDQDGNGYRLRGLRYQSGANGDTSTNEHYGAVLLVLAIGERPSPAMVAACRRVVRRHRTLFPRSARLVGHQTIRPEPTACPGPHVMDLIRSGAFEPIGGR